ncbi:MAG: hypothetical protein JOZ15_19195 [Acidobacteria bacterium]|nr:hypothetical protein [Acidobacteriota bacterium]
MITAMPAAGRAPARRGEPSPALPWRAVGLSALLATGIAAAALPLVAAHTGGWVLRNDGAAYFLYARALVLEGSTDPTAGYRRLDAHFPRDPSGPLAALRESVRTMPGTGRVALPWPVGAGVLMAPFYALGWGAEQLAAARSGRPPDSFGAIPQACYGLGAVVYGLLGFWASYLAAARVADAGASGIAVTALIFAGPAAFYIFFHPTMAHAPSFGLAALLVLLWWRLWDAGQAGVAELAGLALLLGLLVLVRYQNVVFGVLPAALWARLAGRRQWRTASAAVGVALVAGLAYAAPLTIEVSHLWHSGELQLAKPLSWLAASGRSNGAVPAAPAPATPSGGRSAAAAGLPAGAAGSLVLAQNGFDFTSPHLLDVLVSCQHGAFYWTPVLGLGAAALAFQALRHGWARVLGAVLLGSVYLAGCLVGRTNWSGDNSFGMRYLTESVPLLAPALAAWIALAAHPAARWAWTLGLALLVAANGLLMLAFARGTISHNLCVTYPQMAAGIVRALPGTAPGTGHAR